MPGDNVEIRQPSPAEKAPRPKSSGFWKGAAFGALGLGAVIGGSIVGGSISPALSAANNAPQAHVQMQKQQSAPKTLTQHVQQGVHFDGARFGVSPTVRNFGDAPVQLTTDQHQESHAGLQHNIRIDRLMHQDGRALYSSEEAEQATLDFHDQADAANWQTTSRLRPAGHFGNFVSVSETDTFFSGGASGSSMTRLRTIDTRTGQVVNLSEILSGEDYQRVAKDVLAGLNSLQGLPYNVEDLETLDSHMNNGFALHQQKDGSVKLSVAIPSQQESLGEKVAEFSFTLPASAIH